MSDLAFVHEKTNRQYKVVKWDQAAGRITLVGEAGIEFEERYDKELFVRLGYKLQPV